MSFQSKVDLWFLAAFTVSGVGMLLGSLVAFRHPRGRLGGAALAAGGLIFLATIWRISAVQYAITEDGHLDSLGWPFDGRVTSLSQIHRIAESRDPRGSRAASLDRLRIDYGDGGLTFIAVEDEAAFLDAIASREPALQRTPTGLQRRRDSMR